MMEEEIGDVSVGENDHAGLVAVRSKWPPEACCQIPSAQRGTGFAESVRQIRNGAIWGSIYSLLARYIELW